MNAAGIRIPTGTDERRRSAVVVVGVAVGAAVVMIVAALTFSGSMQLILAAPVALAVAGVGVYLGLRHPLVALLYFFIALFFRLALPRILPVDPFLPAFAGLVLSCVIWLCRNPSRIPRPGVVEISMGIYVVWNVVSIVTPHRFPAVAYIPSIEPLNLTRLILTSTVMPFVLYYIGRTLGDRITRTEFVAWLMVAFGAFSAAVSILQFHAPALVWPRYIVTSPNWVGRANGVPNQPGVNGIILLVGFTIAMYFASDRARAQWQRAAAVIVVAASAYAVFLTHTRIIYVALIIVLVVGAVLARGFRSGFVGTLVLGSVIVALNWSTFTSSDRSKGGVGSTGEVFDRLNTAATSFWAFDREPLFGWGLGRFVSVNTMYHQQWAPDIPFERGLGIASHFNELGILVDLGLVGLVLWLAVLTLVAAKIISCYRNPTGARPDFARAMALCAGLSLVVMVTAGTAQDLRLYDMPIVLVMTLAGLAVGQRDGARFLDRSETGARPDADAVVDDHHREESFQS